MVTVRRKQIVTTKDAIFWDVISCCSYKNQRFGGNIATIIRVNGISELGTTLAVTSKHCENFIS
jgi:hypothetical protein